MEFEETDQQDKKIQPYTPVCTKAELKKMLEANHKSTKYSDVKSKIDTWMDVDKVREHQTAQEMRFKDVGNDDNRDQDKRPVSMYQPLGEEQSGNKNFRINSGAPKKPMTADIRKKHNRKGGNNKKRDSSPELEMESLNREKDVDEYDRYMNHDETRKVRIDPDRDLFADSELQEKLEKEYLEGYGEKGESKEEEEVSAAEHQRFIDKYKRELQNE